MARNTGWEVSETNVTVNCCTDIIVASSSEQTHWDAIQAICNGDPYS